MTPQRKKSIKYIVILIVVILIAVSILIYKNKLVLIPLQEQAYDWIKHDQFYGVAHRLGSTFPTDQNRIATFHKSLAQGFRFFEVDLMLTTDRKVICYHGKDLNEKISYHEYVYSSLAKGLAPCDIDDLVKLAIAHPEIYFILDVKNTKRDFKRTYDIIKEKVAAANVGYAFIPQIYSIKQSALVRKGHIFSVEIYTGYRTDASTQEIFEQAIAMHIPVVTLDFNRVINANLNFSDDLFIFTHPINDLKLATSLKQKGIAGIYTSNLSPMKDPTLYQDKPRDIE